MKERWPEMLEYQQKVQAMTDLERADWAKELLLSWMQTRPGGVHQSSIAATEFHRLVRMLAFNVQEAVAAARREGAEEARKQAEAVMEAFAHRMKQTGAEEMRERAADQAHLVWGDGQIAASIRALPLTPEEPT